MRLPGQAAPVRRKRQWRPEVRLTPLGPGERLVRTAEEVVVPDAGRGLIVAAPLLAAARFPARDAP